ncbi:unnamed protein product [marine sediment metagenome]|uniref:Uncharacterized protein n=1 Tax=marine sediment metagenome TaxID=412755 RepID=X0X8A9_9ZZZZ
MDKAQKALGLAEAMKPGQQESKKMLALMAEGVRAQAAIAEQLGRLVELFEKSLVGLGDVPADEEE